MAEEPLPDVDDLLPNVDDLLGGPTAAAPSPYSAEFAKPRAQRPAMSPSDLETMAGLSQEELGAVAAPPLPPALPAWNNGRPADISAGPAPVTSATAGRASPLVRKSADQMLEELFEVRRLLSEPIPRQAKETALGTAGRTLVNAGRSGVDFAIGAAEFPLRAVQGVGEYFTEGNDQPGRSAVGEALRRLPGAPLAAAQTLLTDPAREAGLDLGNRGAEAFFDDPLAVPKALFPAVIARQARLARESAQAGRAQMDPVPRLPPSETIYQDAAPPAAPPAQPAPLALPPGTGIVEVLPKGFEEGRLETADGRRTLAKFQKRQEGVTRDRVAAERQAAGQRAFLRTEAPDRGAIEGTRRAPPAIRNIVDRGGVEPVGQPAPAADPGAEIAELKAKLAELEQRTAPAAEAPADGGVTFLEEPATPATKQPPPAVRVAAAARSSQANPNDAPAEPPPPPDPFRPAPARPGRQAAYQNGRVAARELPQDPAAGERYSTQGAFEDPDFTEGWMDELSVEELQRQEPEPTTPRPPKPVRIRELKGSDRKVTALTGEFLRENPRPSSTSAGKRPPKQARKRRRK